MEICWGYIDINSPLLGEYIMLNTGPAAPQRRKRIYLAADFGGHTAPKILFKQDSLFGDSQTSGETQQEAAVCSQESVVSTQSARQYKDATDLVCEADVAGLDCRNGAENGDLSGTLQSKTNGGYSLNNVHPIRVGKLIRRLTPLECERFQGYPDFWTDIPGASDSARYKALGNSVAIPSVEHVLRGISYFLRKFKREQEECVCTSTPIT